MTVRYCAVIPTYNNPGTIARVAKDVARIIPDVIVVDDGSAPAAREAARGLLRDGTAQVLFRETNGGKGDAVMLGLEHARAQGFTHAIQIDADGQHEANDIEALVLASRADTTALVLGNPVFDGSAPTSRLWARKISIFWCMVETWSRKIGDPLCGFRVYPIEDTLRTKTRAHAMDFDLEVAVRLVWGGTPIVHVPTRVRYFSRGEGGVSHYRAVRDTWLISWAHTRMCTLGLARLFLRAVTPLGRRGGR